MNIISLVTIICCFSLIFDVKGQGAYPPYIDGAEEITYKTVDGTKLNLWIFKPENHKLTDTAPAIVFFFSKPNALVLFNPALVFASTDDKKWNIETSGLEKRMGTKPENISPKKIKLEYLSNNINELRYAK